MNYYEWSNQYYETAQELNNVIIRLKSQRKNHCYQNDKKRKELDKKIAKYREYYLDCMHIAAHLMQRYNGDCE